jgi:hypothetical protein
MTALAIRGSRHHNGVSRIHGGVSQDLLKDFLAAGLARENPVGYITNGVHVPTFLAPEWSEGARPLPRRGLDAPPGLSGHLGKDPRHSRPHLLERAPGHQGADAAHGAPPAS